MAVRTKHVIPTKQIMLTNLAGLVFNGSQSSQRMLYGTHRADW